MTAGNHGAALRQLRTLLERGAVGQLSDAELIDRFLSGNDDAAFAALVERHGPAVFRVCRRVLGDAEAAQDAFQATFLVLVRKAGSVRVRDSIGPWLVAVAYRTASGVRSAASRRKTIERDAAEARAAAEPSDAELAQEVRAEVDRLADRYRRPILLCYFAGLTHEGAARQLGCPVGTVRSRLAWGRKQLRERLVRRGLAPALAFGSLAATPGRASVPTTLLIQTARAASRSGSRRAAGAVSAQAVVQAERVVRGMFMTKLKGIAAALLTLALVATGGGVLAQQGDSDPRSARTDAQLKTGHATQEDTDKILQETVHRVNWRSRQNPAQAVPKVRPDVELEMLLRAAREQEQAGNLDQALALTARMEEALRDWRTKLQPEANQVGLIPAHDYIKRIAVLPGERVEGYTDTISRRVGVLPGGGTPKTDMPKAKDAPRTDMPKAEEVPKTGPLGGAKPVQKPSDENDKLPPGAKPETAQPSPKDAQRAAAPFPETTTIDFPAGNKMAATSQERPRSSASRTAGANNAAATGRPLLTLDDAQQAAVRFQRENPFRTPRFTGPQLAAELDKRKVSVHGFGRMDLVPAIKALRTAHAGPDGPVPIYFDLKGPGGANAKLVSKVILDIEDLPLRQALKMVLDQAGLTFQVEDARIVITEATNNPPAGQKP